MALIKREQLSGLIEEIETGAAASVYLVFGERYLCREAADKLEKALLQTGGNCHRIDGDREDPVKTLNGLRNFSLLPGRQLYRVTDSRLFHSREVASAIWRKAEQAQEAGKKQLAVKNLRAMTRLGGLESEDRLSSLTGDQWQKLFGFSRPAGELGWADELLAQAPEKQSSRAAGDISSQYLAAFKKGLPAANILLLSAESVDKRKKLFTHIKKEGSIVDCSVATGATSAAKKDQGRVLRELVGNTLDSMGKTIEPRVVEPLLERVGFHPVAVVTEIEKLALYVGDRQQIGLDDLNTMVGRTREDALFELTEAFSKKQTGRTLTVLSRLLENGVHGLAVLATLRNYLRRLLIFRSLQMQDDPVYRKGMSANQFQQEYLPALKATDQWTEMLKGHPYALYMSFSQAEKYSCVLLKKWLELLLGAEYRFKSSSLDQHLVLEEMLLDMLAGS
ncbi:MAG: DNA polymerase III subunit delta [Thermodesulfobacteriota bacterium]